MEKYVWVILIVLVLLLLFWGWKENLTQPDYLDQMAMKYSDPTYFKYSSWERDVAGMSPRDYYLENQANYLNQIAPGYFKGDGLYVDHTDYLDMPAQYRPMLPKGALSMQKQTGLEDKMMAQAM